MFTKEYQQKYTKMYPWETPRQPHPQCDHSLSLNFSGSRLGVWGTEILVSILGVKQGKLIIGNYCRSLSIPINRSWIWLMIPLAAYSTTIIQTVTTAVIELRYVPTSSWFRLANGSGRTAIRIWMSFVWVEKGLF